MSSNSRTLLKFYGENKEQLALNPQLLRVIGSKGEPRIAVGITSEGNPGLGIYGSKNNQMKLGSDRIILKKDETDRARLWLKDDGDPLLQYIDRYGKKRLLLSLSRGAPVMGILNEYDKIIWTAP